MASTSTQENQYAGVHSSRVLGYARVSTRTQDLTYQLNKLKAAGCSRIFQEKASGKSRESRTELARLLNGLCEGDLLLATATDRIARDPLDLLNVLQTVRQAGAALKLLDEPFIDTTSEMSDLIVFLVGWAARWQRRRILENTAHGRELARKRGVKFGRKPKLSEAEKRQIRKDRLKGKPTSKIAREFGVSRSTIQRVLYIIGQHHLL
ncbi:recombinase family protein [Breoghania corrubedonensis]|uniref:recombinase family protein n=1 Tax=Breoghania corrubedonensis TaxID=665038 RepID=UPI001FE87E5B|nr:recombinase family protein [Breoghania corrubedonensis]